jgi:hypothetical protein
LNADPHIQSRAFVGILVILFLLTLPLVNPWVRGDGVGYYAYARAPLIEHNLDFTHDYQAANQSFRDERIDSRGQPKPFYRTRTGHLDNHFTVGPAILWSPFLILAHGGVLFARLFGASTPADGFSAPYRYAFAYGTALYGFLALLIAFRLARKYLPPLWAFLAVLAVWGGSSLPVYMYFNPSWSHAHSAFAVALFLWYWDSTRDQRSLSQWLWLGLIVGLMLNVYYPNLMLLAVLLGEAVPQYFGVLRSHGVSSPSFSRLFTCHAAFSLVVCLALLPTFITRWIVYGGPFETGYYSVRDFLWGSPVFLQVLFSANHGLLSWTPLIIFCLFGLFLSPLRFPSIGVPFLLAAVAFYLFIAVYPDWAGISSFGNRFFVSLTAIFIFGLALFLDYFAALFSRRWLAISVSCLGLACFVIWNFGMIYQWGTHLIPARGPISFRQAADNQFHAVPGGISSQLRSYLLHRGELMRQIEQKDIEQMKNNSHP